MKILVGIMYCKENEFGDCIKSIQSQTYKNFDYFVVENLPNKEAHDKLYKTFLDSKDKYNIFIKIDADMVLCRNDLFENIVHKFKQNTSMDLLSIKVQDFFTGRLIWGLNIYRNTVTLTNLAENIFVDIVVKFENLVRDDSELAPAAFHCPNPSKFQSYHYGMHKAVKFIQRDADNYQESQGMYHLNNILNMMRNYMKTNNDFVGIACLGAQIAQIKRFTYKNVNYDDSQAMDVFKDIESLSPQLIQCQIYFYSFINLIISSLHCKCILVKLLFRKANNFLKGGM